MFRASMHLNGVADIAQLLALKRGLDKDMLMAAGLLHDLWAYKKGTQRGHAKQGARLARRILDKLGLFSEKKRKIITTAIKRHSGGRGIQNDYDKALKDADILKQYLSDPGRRFPKAKVRRIQKVMEELGINAKVKIRTN